MSLPGTLVEPGWLQAHLSDAGIVVADVRWHPDGDARSAYRSSHLPGAVYVDVDEDLAGAPFVDGPGRHPLPRADVFASKMSALGIGDEHAVVVYDDALGSSAARLWWMLRVGGRRAGLLNGGIAGWTGELESGESRRAPASFSSRPWPAARVVDAAEVAAVIRSGSGPVLDARAVERYRGDEEPIDPVAGHIPGAVSAPWGDVGDPESGRLRPPAELRRRFEALGVQEGSNPIAYCGSGITAALDLLALEVAGLGGGRLYAGSWSDWVTDPARPVATGSDPSSASRRSGVAGSGPGY